MSAISRSEYQKVVEENKRLKHDIYKLVIDDDEETLEVYERWEKHFRDEMAFKNMIRYAILNKAGLVYIKDI